MYEADTGQGIQMCFPFLIKMTADAASAVAVQHTNFFTQRQAIEDATASRDSCSMAKLRLCITFCDKSEFPSEFYTEF